MFEHGDSNNGFSIKASGHSDGTHNDWSVRAEGRWQDNAACEMWKRPNDPDSTFRLPEDLTKKDIDRVIMPNGDRFSVNEDGRWKYVDSEGHQITKEISLDTDMAGTSKYVMSNDAILTQGEFSNSIKYPNGDSIVWARNGDIQTVNVDDRPKDVHDRLKHVDDRQDADDRLNIDELKLGEHLKERPDALGGISTISRKISTEAFEEMRSQLDVPPIDFRGT